MPHAFTPSPAVVFPASQPSPASTTELPHTFVGSHTPGAPPLTSQMPLWQDVPPPDDLLFLYRLPSGKEVVGNHANFLADKGALFDEFDTSVKAPTGSGAPELFVCKLPSGVGVVATYEECLADGGTVVGILPGRKQKHRY